jgi:hypothetical protein
MEKAVHPGYRGGHQVALLAEKAHVTPLSPLAAKVSNTGEQHAAGTTSRVVDGFTGLRFKYFGHQMHDSSICVELGGSVAGIISELLNQVFVTLTEFVLGEVGERQV